MTTESELRRENLQLREEITMLELRQENRELKRQVDRLQKGKSPESSMSTFYTSVAVLSVLLTMYLIASL